MRSGFLYKHIEVEGVKRYVVSVQYLSQTVTVREDDGTLKRYPLSSVNKMDLHKAREKLTLGTL